MAWTTISNLAQGDLVTESHWDYQLKGNLEYLLSLVEPNTLTNKSGGALEEGDVVVADASNDNAFTTTTTANDVDVIGVVKESIANNATGRVSVAGIVTVKVQGNVARGDFLATSTTAKRAATAGASPGTGTFARALTAYSGGGAGTVTALLVFTAAGGGAVPANMVAYTSAGAAPSGYSEVTGARGRVIVGLPSGGTNAGTVGTALTNLQDKTHTHTYSTVIAHTHTQIGFTSGTGAEAIVNVDASASGYQNANETASTGSASGTTSTAALSDIFAYIQYMTIKKD
jgi:hypothetical protein